MAITHVFSMVSNKCPVSQTIFEYSPLHTNERGGCRSANGVVLSIPAHHAKKRNTDQDGTENACFVRDADSKNASSRLITVSYKKLSCTTRFRNFAIRPELISIKDRYFQRSRAFTERAPLGRLTHFEPNENTKCTVWHIWHEMYDLA